MENDRLITVAIHTHDKAVALKATLEREGVKASLQNVNLESPVVSSGVRVRICESDLPLALRIIENPEVFPAENISGTSGLSGGHIILVPIDFSPRSQNAVKVAFSIAQPGHRVVLLHSYIVPRTGVISSLASNLNFDNDITELTDAESSVSMANAAHGMMKSFEADLRRSIKDGSLPGRKFSSVLMEGVPEECIGLYVKEHANDVRLVVMATRAVEQKAHDLAGSVTAEVLDSCRVQALTVPDCDKEFTLLKSVENVILLSNLEQEDFLALDAMNRLMPEGKALNVRVSCLPNGKYNEESLAAARSALGEYCRNHFPQYNFSLTVLNKQVEEIDSEGANMIVVPNRKKNIFARLLNPGMAHRILFHTDVPMLVVPV